MLLPKPKRLKDPTALKQARHDRCEVCGGTWGLEVHHVVTRKSGGPDIKENTLTLDINCHYGKVPSGKLSRHFLFEIIARREGLTVDEVEEKVYQAKRGIY